MIRQSAVLAAATLLPLLVQAQVHPLEQLINASRGGPSTADLADLATKTLSPHGGVAVWGEDYLFVSDLTVGPKNEPVSASTAGVSIDMQPRARDGQNRGL